MIINKHLGRRYCEFLQTENKRLNDASKMVHTSQLNFLERNEAKYYEQEENDANKVKRFNF